MRARDETCGRQALRDSRPMTFPSAHNDIGGIRIGLEVVPVDPHWGHRLSERSIDYPLNCRRRMHQTGVALP